MLTFGNETGTKSFLENRNLFGNSKTQPEKFNLYSGLALLADTVKKQDAKLDNLAEQVEELKALIKRIK